MEGGASEVAGDKRGDLLGCEVQVRCVECIAKVECMD